MSAPQHTLSPRTARSNSLSSLRSSSERHLRFSLARMASHEATEIPHTHEEDTEEANGESSSTHSSQHDRQNSNGEPLVKRIEHEAQEAAEEGIEAATGRGIESSPSLPEEEAEGDDRSVKRHSGEGSHDGHDLEAQHEDHLPGGRKGRKEVELQDQTNLLPVRQVIVVFAGLSTALFVSLLDQTIVSTALPELGRVFRRADIVSWVGTAYLLTSTAFQPIYSRLSDIFGRKVILLLSLAIFWVGSLACALANSMIQLIVFRALAGVGGGGILTMVMVCVSDVVSLKDRGKYQGILGGVVALSNSLGPVLGGIFVDKASWRWCFYINLPMIAIGMIVCVFALPLKAVKGDIKSKLKKIDYGGSALTLAWAVLILLPLSWGGTQYEWDSAAVIAPLVIGVVLLVAFILYEWKVAVLPVIPMHIFKDITVAGAMVATLLSGMVFFVNLYYLPQYFQVVWGASAIRSGVLLLPLILVQTVMSFTSGIIVSKTGDYRVNIYLGFAIWTIGQGLLSTIGRNTSLGKLVGFQILSGIGAGQTFQTTLVAIQATVSRSEMAVATGARNFIRMLGGTIALAVSSAILNNSVKSSLKSLDIGQDVISRILLDPTQLVSIGLSPSVRNAALDAYSKGINNIYYFMTPCTGIAFIVSVLCIKAHSLNRDDDKALKEQGKAWADKHSKKARQDKKHGAEEAGSGEKAKGERALTGVGR